MASAEVEGDKYRSFIYGESEKNTVWRDGAPPNYDVVNKLFEEGRTQVIIQDYMHIYASKFKISIYYSTLFKLFDTTNI